MAAEKRHAEAQLQDAMLDLAILLVMVMTSDCCSTQVISKYHEVSQLTTSQSMLTWEQALAVEKWHAGEQLQEAMLELAGIQAQLRDALQERQEAEQQLAEAGPAQQALAEAQVGGSLERNVCSPQVETGKLNGSMQKLGLLSMPWLRLRWVAGENVREV